jgi:hypothetical protein
MNRLSNLHDQVITYLAKLNLNSIKVDELSEDEVITMMKLCQYIDNVRKTYAKK